MIETDYDFWYAVGEADGELEEGESERLNEHGSVYYVQWKPGWEPGQAFWPDSVGYMTLDDAKGAAASKLSGEVSWS